jgi:hypothetical protein
MQATRESTALAKAEPLAKEQQREELAARSILLSESQSVYEPGSLPATGPANCGLMTDVCAGYAPALDEFAAKLRAGAAA